MKWQTRSKKISPAPLPSRTVAPSCCRRLPQSSGGPAAPWPAALLLLPAGAPRRRPRTGTGAAPRDSEQRSRPLSGTDRAAQAAGGSEWGAEHSGKQSKKRETALVLLIATERARRNLPAPRPYTQPARADVRRPPPRLAAAGQEELSVGELLRKTQRGALRERAGVSKTAHRWGMTGAVCEQGPGAIARLGKRPEGPCQWFVAPQTWPSSTQRQGPGRRLP